MNINSPQDACKFLITYRLLGLCSETQNLVSCMDALSRMCSCDTQEAKNNKFNQCKQNYISFVSKSNVFKNEIFSKLSGENRINFSFNGQPIGTICR